MSPAQNLIVLRPNKPGVDCQAFWKAGNTGHLWMMGPANKQLSDGVHLAVRGLPHDQRSRAVLQFQQSHSLSCAYFHFPWAALSNQGLSSYTVLLRGAQIPYARNSHALTDEI